MNKALIIGLAALAFGAQSLAAQQPKDAAGQQMQMMESMNARLDSLVGRMNRTSGNAKITAMAQVINELVAQRRAMQNHMHKMMEARGGMTGRDTTMKRTSKSVPPQTPSPGAPGADTSNHTEHHPDQ